MDKVIALMKEIALDNYQNGGDQVYECWTDEDYMEFYIDHKENWKEEFEKLFDTLEERRKDVNKFRF